MEVKVTRRRYWFRGEAQHVCVSSLGVPFVPLKSDLVRSDGLSVMDAPYVRHVTPSVIPVFRY